MEAHLKIEHAPFVAPGLNFFDAAPVTFRDAKFHETKSVIGKAWVAQAHPIATMGLQVRENLALDEFDEDRL